MQVFQKLAPNQAVPRQLVDAQTRADAMAANYPELQKSLLLRPSRPAEPQSTSDIGTDQSAVWGDDDSACPWSWFSTAQCGSNTQSCLGFVDGAKSIQHDDVNYAAGTSVQLPQWAQPPFSVSNLVELDRPGYLVRRARHGALGPRWVERRPRFRLARGRADERRRPRFAHGVAVSNTSGFRTGP